MNLAAFAQELNVGVAFFKGTTDFDQLPQAAQRLWIKLWELSHFGEDAIRITDRELAKACNRGIRWVQKALAQLLGLETDGEATPIVSRERKYGPREIAGRILKLIVPFAKPKPQDPPSAPKGKAKGKTAPAAPSPAPATPQAGPPAPAPAPPPEPRLTPEEEAEAQRVWDEIRARAQAQKQATPKDLYREELTKAIRRDLKDVSRRLDQLRNQPGAGEDPAARAEIERLTGTQARLTAELEARGHPRE